MAEYNAVKDVKNRAGELIKRAQEDPEFVPTSSAAKTLHPNQEILSRNRKTLSGYFNKHHPSQEGLKRTFEQIKSKGLDRGIDR